MPASLAAALNEGNARVTPGKSSDVVVNGMSSEPKNSASTAAAAPLKVLCPETHSGNGGVTSKGVHEPSATVSGFPSVSALRMAVIGRQKLYRYLQSQATIPASARAKLSNAKRRAFS